ncbi:hypothetical protein Tco_1329077 [Tanacetum coccineum]
MAQWHTKKGEAVSDFAKSKSISEQRQYLSIFFALKEFLQDPRECLLLFVNLEAAEVVAKGQSTTQVVEDLLLLRICGKETESRICDAEANATSSVDVYWTKKMQIQTERHSRKLWLIAMHVNGEAKLGTKLEWIGNAAKDDERFADVVKSRLFAELLLKLKIKEETYGDE